MIASMALAVALATGARAVAAPSRVSNIAYAADGIDAHELDLYLPAHRAGAPLVVFVHGGAFMHGDRRDYVELGTALAAEGLAVAIPSYRLFPRTDAQGSTQDVALATAWMLGHAADYALDATSAILAGHSAGGQIVAMLGTHRRYLEAAGTSLHAIRGVFAIAGAYDVRDLSDEPLAWQEIDGKIYGERADDRAKISPALDIDAGAPPVEAVCGTNDDAGSCPRTLSFVRALHDAGAEARTFRDVGADHMDLLRDLIDPVRALHDEFRAFVNARSQFG